ncbi:hypothetical protein PMAYCL1PPCAC_01009 [Pristionchus mayeri]|uniref:Chloride channel protein n=1 Tax=Pristionchus mayeri TaxID=1317129 RepID=A0AAN5C6J8_9BILA|nr:hypothetical protein PMAYCL1PPCAC_01009 [Pristionchus mayeri]
MTPGFQIFRTCCKRAKVSPENYHPTKDGKSKGDGAIKAIARRTWIHIEDWVYLTILGIVCAGMAVLLEYIISRLNQVHLLAYGEVDKIETGWRIPATYGVWVGYVVLLIMGSAACTKFIAPLASGSGFPEMKCVLRGTILKEYLTIRTMLGKFLGLTLSMSSGIPNGREGPLVHIFAAFAMQLSRLAAFTGIYSNESRCSEMLAAGAAVGVAATFSAPVGGVLLSIELTSVLFAVRNYWRCFYAATWAALVMLIVLPAINDPYLDIQPQYQTHFPTGKAFAAQELPLFALLGLFIGIISVLFIKFHRHLVLFLRRNWVCKKVFQANFFVYPLLVSAVVGSITYPELLGQFMAGKKKFLTTLIDFFAVCTWTDVDFGPICNSTITDNYNGLHHNVSIFVSLPVFIVVHFFLSIFCHTMPIPSGIIISSLGIGAATGRLMGEILAVINGGYVWSGSGIAQAIYPGVYAVAGSAAMVGSVTHTISTAVIMFEMTGQLVHLLPVLITVIVANTVCSFFEISIIDSIIKLRSLPYLPDLSSGSSVFHLITVGQFMVTPVHFIHKQSTYREVRDLLKEAPKISTIPIVDSLESELFIGTVARRKLEQFVNDKIGKEFSSGRASPDNGPASPTRIFSIGRLMNNWRKDGPESVSSVEQGNGTVTPYEIAPLESIHIDELIDLDSISIDETPIQVTARTSLFKIHWLFSLLSVSRIFITERGALRGVVALKEVREAIQAVNKGELKPNQEIETPDVPRNRLASIASKAVDYDSDQEEDHLQGRLEIVRGAELTDAHQKSVHSLDSADPRHFVLPHSSRMDHMTRERNLSISLGVLARRNARSRKDSDSIV